MEFNKNIIIDNKSISKKSPTFVIAEAGVNHNGDMKIAKQLIDIAVDANADAVKFQHYKAKTLVSEKGFSSADVRAAHQDGWTSSVFSTYHKSIKFQREKFRHTTGSP